MIILIVTEMLFHVIRSLFIGYIAKRIFNQTRYGLIAIILYFIYVIIPLMMPYFNVTRLMFTFIAMIVSIVIYSQLFQLTSFRFRKKLTSVSLDIYTIWYEQFVLRMISIVFIVTLIIFQFLSGPMNLLLLSFIVILVLGFNVYQFIQDKHKRSYIIIRLGKDTYSYEQKEINYGTSVLKYQDFFSSDMFILDKIGSVQYTKDHIKRMDYVYAIKQDTSFSDQGFKKDTIPYIDVLNTLKHYQLVKVKIKGNQTKIKRLK